MADLSLLDQSVTKLLDAAKDLPAEDIEQLLAAETVGKTRTSAMAGLKALLAAEELVEEPNAVVEGDNVPEAPEEAPSEPAPEQPAESTGPNTITNCKKGTTLHLGDGRKLAFGESGNVSHELADHLRETGQAE
jgi:hypothetical protein